MVAFIDSFIHFVIISYFTDDGGLKQTFELQAFTLQADHSLMMAQPQLTLHSELSADFVLNNLEPGSTFMLYVYAVNVKGLSAPVILPVSTLKEAAKRTVPPSTTDTFGASVAGAVAMGTGAAFLLIIITGIVAVLRCKQNQSERNRRNSRPEPILIQHDGAHQQSQSQRIAINGNCSQMNGGSSVINGTVGIRDNSRNRSRNENELIDAADSAAQAGFYDYRPIRQRQQQLSSFGGHLLSPATTPLYGSSRCNNKLPPDYVANLSDVPESCV